MLTLLKSSPDAWDLVRSQTEVTDVLAAPALPLTQVTVLERMREAGKKILMSGGTRWWVPLLLHGKGPQAHGAPTGSLQLSNGPNFLTPAKPAFHMRTHSHTLGMRSNVLPMFLEPGGGLGTDYFSESPPSAVRAVFSSWTLDECRAW